MAGHSKWSTIKRKKAATDAKRGKLFTKLLKEIQVAAKLGGGSVDGNPRLKAAVATAKSNSVPNDKIDSAIKKGTGDVEGVDYEEITYEGYGPGGVAIIIKTLTDNKNRTVAEVRHALSKNGGSLAGSNAVAYLFKEKGVFTFDADQVTEEELFDASLEAGAEDITKVDDVWEVMCEPGEFGQVRDALEGLGKEFEGELRPIPETSVEVAGKDAQALLRVLDMLDDLDDVQNVTANFDIASDEMDAFSEG